MLLETHQKLHSVSRLYSLGMVKIEVFDDRRFMHQFVTLTNVRTYVRMYIWMYVCMYVCVYVCMYVCMYCVGVYVYANLTQGRVNQMNIMKSEAQMYFRPKRS